MLGSSRESLVVVGEALRARSGDPAFAGVGSELLSVAALLGRESSLRATLSDSGIPLSVRTGVVDQILGSRVSAPAVEIVKVVVEQRWSRPRDLVEALDRLAAEALFVGAERDGRIDAVEDELFRVGRAVSGSGELSFALTDPVTPADRKTALIGSLIGDKVQPETLALVDHVVADPRGRTIEAALGELVELAAVRRDHVVAEVTSAVALTEAQVTRLAGVLGRIYGRDVDIRTEIDPAVIGGISIRVGDEVIDGTTVHRLEQARRRVVG